MTPFYDNISRYTLADLYRKNWAVISGGFLGGDIYSLNRFHQLCHQLVVDLIYRKYVDDDQVILSIIITFARFKLKYIVIRTFPLQTCQFFFCAQIFYFKKFKNSHILEVSKREALLTLRNNLSTR